jgi:hypothetical protein
MAELIGVGEDSEKALIALMVACCDPMAIALTAAVSARRSRIAQNHIGSRSTFGSCRGDAIERHSRCGPEPEVSSGGDDEASNLSVSLTADVMLFYA